ncbi:MAG: hybrid sensor histidine kinase/response regulator [Candidatus Promineifilaceae bacterium]
MTTILVIEDEPSLREDIALILELNDYETVCAADGSEGLDLIKQCHPDLVVSDVMMPRLDGHGLLQEVRQDPTIATTPFIFLTAKAEPTSIRHGMELGADDYLPKPFSSEQLTRAIRTQLKKRDMLAEQYNVMKRSFHNDLFFVLPHEINTPLNGIIGLADLIRQEQGLMPKDELMEFANYILDSGQRLHHTLSNVLLYAQIELRLAQSEQIEAMRRRSCPDAFMELATAIQALTDNNVRAADINLNIEDAKLQISCENLRKIMSELLSNALKFSAPNTPIHISGRVDGDTFVLSISDQGRGMTEEQIARVGPYQQFERQLYEQQGTGLGLAIVSKLAALYGGQLTISRNQPKGVSVSLQLPLAD